ncbi:heparinase II/III domain-containing protein [Falsirhodobacter sp. 20TX0035]|uniref:heparinase II/III domain-containing protein n=1 Tax=Falsirhodobacter sp. 20TX0035 TaxID=3022019 RepID=UPI00232D19DD|nr:heparinase II/III family protein [Falsirhodobacter sp. 20TX0035]MDB6453953.1 heparinase II/III family protein [Falsirhodobacter sp. 20TX0035]
MTGTRLGDRIAAWRSKNTVPAERLLPMPPLPLTGNPDRAEALLAQDTVWGAPDAMAFGWLDDLAALGDERTGRFAARMAGDWVTTFGTGRGWTPEATGLRLLRWLTHARFLYPRGVPAPVMDALCRQSAYLADRWQGAAPGWPRIAALAGLSAAALALERPGIRPALPPLPPLPRRPDDLLQALILLVALRDTWPEAALSVIEDATGTLRMMRHADGRVTGLRSGADSDPVQLDAALVASRVRGPVPPQGMGLMRLMRGRSSVLMDVSAPDFAFELTAGRCPIVIAATNRRAGLQVLGAKAARPHITAQHGPTDLVAGHDGWKGMLCTRSLSLTPDGHGLTGSDRLEPRARRPRPVEMMLTFPLHPDIRAEQEPDALRLTLPDGTVWRFTADGARLHGGHTIVLPHAVPRFPARIDWTFAKSDATPLTIRDLPTGA